MSNSADRNEDPITGSPGSHPVGTGVGAAAGGASGAAIGSVGGPVGTLAGGVIGAIVGGLTGHAAAEAVDPTVEDEYWRSNYSDRGYISDEDDYETFRPAYRHGWESRLRYEGEPWEAVETDIESDWNRRYADTELTWNQAQPATRDAWDRIERTQRYGDQAALDSYWEEQFYSKDYVSQNDAYEDYRPAYRYGWRAKIDHVDDSWEAAENRLQREWNELQGESRLGWEKAKHAVRDAWHEVERRLPGDFDRDGR